MQITANNANKTRVFSPLDTITIICYTFVSLNVENLKFIFLKKEGAMVILENGYFGEYWEICNKRSQKVAGGNKNGRGLTIVDSIVFCDECCCLFQIEEKDVGAGKVNEQFFRTGIPVLTIGGRNNSFSKMITAPCPNCARPVIFLFED